MKKIQYKCRKWDKEVKNVIAFKSFGGSCKNIQLITDLYFTPEKFKDTPIYNQRIKDPVSFYEQLGGQYELLSYEIYLTEGDTESSIGYLYLYVKALARSYELELSGVVITNPAIESRHSQKRDLEQISFAAAAIGKLELFEKYGDGIGCELIKAMYHKDYDKARQLAEKLPNTEEMYEKYKRFESYYYGSCYMKDLV